MRKLALTVATSTIILCGCSALSPAASPSKTLPVSTNVANKKAAGELDLVEVQDQLSRFVEIIELLESSKSTKKNIKTIDGIALDLGGELSGPISSKNKQAAPTSGSGQLVDVINSINNNLEKLENTQDEAQSIREMLSIADQYSGNKQNLFSEIFEILTRKPSSSQ